MMVMMISSGQRHNNTCFGLRRPRAMSLDSDDEYVTNPSDVPQGFLAVYVGKERSRFVIPMNYLNFPVFRELLDQAAEEFGFVHRGGLTIPCDEEFFKKVLGFIQTPQSKNKPLKPLKPCHDRERENNSMSIKPLLKSSIQRSLA